jgi:PhnB protein
MPVQPIPEGFRTVTPYLIVDGVPRLIAFLKDAFGARLTEQTPDNQGRIMHAQVRINDSMVMMGAAMTGFPAQPVHLYLYVPNVDDVYRQAVAAGGVSVMEPADQFYGDRTSGVKDPSGNTWWIGTHIEDVSSEELARRVAARGDRS